MSADLPYYMKVEEREDETIVSWKNFGRGATLPVGLILFAIFIVVGIVAGTLTIWSLYWIWEDLGYRNGSYYYLVYTPTLFVGCILGIIPISILFLIWNFYWKASIRLLSDSFELVRQSIRKKDVMTYALKDIIGIEFDHALSVRSLVMVRFHGGGIPWYLEVDGYLMRRDQERLAIFLDEKVQLKKKEAASEPAPTQTE